MRLVLPLLACLVLSAPGAARAAESYDNCTGFITSLPAVITTQGTWCMDKDLATAITSGSAISVNTNNVTLDCNHFKLGGLSAGPTSTTLGVNADPRLNLTVRNCNIRGFWMGVYSTGSGTVVEDNRFEGSLFAGIYVQGEGSFIRRNLVLDTAGNLPSGIFSEGGTEIIDNSVLGVVANPGSGAGAFGIRINSGASTLVAGNRIRGLVPDGGGEAVGIMSASGSQVVMRDNSLFDAGTAVFGLYCGGSGFAQGNTVIGFPTTMLGCTDAGGNYTTSP